MTSFEDEWERAGQISERLQVVARTEPVRVGFKSNSAAQLAVEKLKTSDPARRFRKPLFASPEKWVRNTVVWQRDAFQMLAINIELAFKAPGPAGGINYWNGYGLPIDYKADLGTIQLGLGGMLSPKWIYIVLFEYFEHFSDLLQPFDSEET